MNLNADSTNDTNLITFSPTHIFREVVISRISSTELGLAMSRDDSLRRQVDDVCEAPTQMTGICGMWIEYDYTFQMTRKIVTYLICRRFVSNLRPILIW